LIALNGIQYQSGFYQAILVLIGIYQLTTSRKTHGCSLKIHRVELDVIKGNCTFVKV
jgi:hypothetical protein